MLNPDVLDYAPHRKAEDNESPEDRGFRVSGGRIGYLTGETVKALLKAGVTQVWYGVSTTPEYAGDLVSVYFFNPAGIELAHQTQLAGQLGNPDVTLLTRTWGELILARGYQRTFRWNAFMVDPDQLQDDVVYRVV